AGARAGAAELSGTGVAVGDEVLGRGDEVLPGVRFGGLVSGLVPSLAFLAAAARVRVCEDDPVQRNRPAHAEERRVARAIGAIAFQDGTGRAVALHVLAVNDRERDHRAIVAGRLDLLDDQVLEAGIADGGIEDALRQAVLLGVEIIERGWLN